MGAVEWIVADAGAQMHHPATADRKESRVDAKSRSSLRRFVPIAVVAAGLLAAYAFGLHRYLSLMYLADSRDALLAFVADHYVLALLVFGGVYFLAVAFSIPAASVLTVFAGFLFDWLVGGLLVVVAATAGATAVFLAAQTAFGDVLRRRAGGFASRLAEGFERDAFGYLLALRLAPVVPFFILNIVPALFNVRPRTYVLATFLGILPGSFAYAYLGAGIDSVLVAAQEAGQAPSVTDLVTPKITIAFGVLALVALLAVVVRKVLGRRC